MDDDYSLIETAREVVEYVEGVQELQFGGYDSAVEGVLGYPPAGALYDDHIQSDSSLPDSPADQGVIIPRIGLIF